jgi:hypothetical protein
MQSPWPQPKESKPIAVTLIKEEPISEAYELHTELLIKSENSSPRSEPCEDIKMEIADPDESVEHSLEMPSTSKQTANQTPAATRLRVRRYCSVYGCLINSYVRPDLAYFSLPSDMER